MAQSIMQEMVESSTDTYDPSFRNFRFDIGKEMAQSTVQEIVENSADTYDPSNDPQRTEKMELIKYIKSVVGTRRQRMKPLNVVVLGCPGSGKSAFLNTVFTSFRTDKWAERARVGDYGRTGERQVTNNVLSYSSATDYYPEEPDVVLPTFIDVQGLEDANDSFNKEFLRGLLNGNIQNGQYMKEIREIYDNNIEEFRKVIENQPGQMKVDRVVVVVSGDPTVPLPSNLLNCIHDMSRSKRDIPIFGVMTRKDKFEGKHEVKDITCSFLNMLGITKDRFLFMTNYCTEIDNYQPRRYHKSVFPYIDVPVLQFLQQVVCPHRRVINSTTGFGSSTWSINLDCFRMDVTEISPLILMQIGLLLMFLYWLSFPSISFYTLNTLCADYTAANEKHSNTLNIRGLDDICSAKTKISSFPTATALFYTVFTFFAIPYLDSIHLLMHDYGIDIMKYYIYAGAVVVPMFSLLLSKV